MKIKYVVGILQALIIIELSAMHNPRSGSAVPVPQQHQSNSALTRSAIQDAECKMLTDKLQSIERGIINGLPDYVATVITSSSHLLTAVFLKAGELKTFIDYFYTRLFIDQNGLGADQRIALFNTLLLHVDLQNADLKRTFQWQLMAHLFHIESRYDTLEIFETLRRFFPLWFAPETPERGEGFLYERMASLIQQNPQSSAAQSYAAQASFSGAPVTAGTTIASAQPVTTSASNGNSSSSASCTQARLLSQNATVWKTLPNTSISKVQIRAKKTWAQFFSSWKGMGTLVAGGGFAAGCWWLYKRHKKGAAQSQIAATIAPSEIQLII